MRRKSGKVAKPVRWRIECLAHTLVEWLAGALPGPWVFRLGEALGALAWHLLPTRRAIVLRNLRIAYAGEMSPEEIHQLARQTFRRSGANLVCAAHTARLPEARLKKILHIENPELLAETLAQGRGLVILLAHMGNWELLTRLVHFFPPGSKCGAFYRPLNNPLLDERVLRRRQAHGTRMFSKRDPFHQVTAFLREGAIVGILADQRVGTQGDVVSFFGRLTRTSPLPGLLARRTRSPVLALSLTTSAPGTWQARYLPVSQPPTTANCMMSLERAMKGGPVDVFWFQERWKIYTRRGRTIRDWLGDGETRGAKPHRALLWLAGAPETWRLPEEWTHPDVVYEAALTSGAALPSWLPETTRIHEVSATPDGDMLQKRIATIDESAILALDYILAPGASKPLVKAGHREAIAVISLP